ncbi:MAG: HAMP domain-containing histidine kinase [Bacteroidetes bacterium]|nr:HAMP domain-containing histidine kinase [Bacteroidota bacterium]
MINLIPQNTSDLDYLWELVSERNKWFIKLRYIAVVLLLCLYIFIVYLTNEYIFIEQKTGIAVILCCILAYNLIFSYLSGTKILKNEISAFHPIKFALLQILLDLTALMFIVYLTGLINSPFYLFFIFHAIIGSLILPGRIIYFLMIVLLSFFTVLNFSVHFGFIREFPISNTESVRQLSLNYLVLNLMSFWLMILLSVQLVNHLTSALYRREQQLMNAIEKIEQTEIEKQKYILAVVHEVKSPLSVILSYLNLLVDGIAGEISEKARDILIKMKRRSAEAIELTNNILEVSKIKQLKKLNRVKTEPELIVRGIFEAMNDKARSEMITLHFTDSRKEKKSFYADKSLMELMLSNVISNAVKYNHMEGKVEVVFSDRNDGICITVADTGIGIPAEEMMNITNEFYRAGNAKSTKKEGTGLGLYVVKQIVEKHNGKLHIKSPSDIGTAEFPGTSVIILLPYGEVSQSS